MGTIADISEPASELEHLIADLSESGLLVFVFGAGRWLVHGAPHRGDNAGIPRTGRPALVARRNSATTRRAGRWTCGSMRSPGSGSCAGPIRSRFFPGREVLTVQFLGPGRETALHCYVHDLYDGQRMRPEKLDAWRALRERYGNRDESSVDRGTLLAPAA